jgi:hypothetical protein
MPLIHANGGPKGASGEPMSLKQDSWEVAKDDLCPCESGARYGKCCKKKKFKWLTDKKGHIFRSSQMTAETLEAVNVGMRRFKEIFGRNPGSTDRVFPDTYLITGVDYDRHLGQAMRAANIRPELIYAGSEDGSAARGCQAGHEGRAGRMECCNR